jgi:signal transduction histidine kinase
MLRNVFPTAGMLLLGGVLSALAAVAEVSPIQFEAWMAVASTSLIMTIAAAVALARSKRAVGQLPDAVHVQQSESENATGDDPVAQSVLPDEIQSVLHDVDQALVRSRNNNQARNDFVANMSHELRTPLNSTSASLKSSKNQSLANSQKSNIRTSQIFSTAAITYWH